VRDTYLVQRLLPPNKLRLGPNSIAPHRVFGGAMLGLSEKAWDVLDEVCTVDYMGAAEYEFGTLPKSFGGLLDSAKAGELRAFAFTLTPGERKLSWDRGWHGTKGPLPPAQTVCIYGFGRESDLEEIQKRIRSLTSEEKGIYVKSGTRLVESLDLDLLSKKRLGDPTVGWFELNNLFMFFSDRKMWEDFCTLFGVETCEVPEIPVAPDYSKLGKKELCSVALNLGVCRTKTEANKFSKKDLLAKLQPVSV